MSSLISPVTLKNKLDLLPFVNPPCLPATEIS
nr:MAG TPA: hypothetical protein [Caudoviricetes sp.]